MIWMGGAGATLSLVIAMLIFARSKTCAKWRAGRGASVFNINEPILFGLPVIMNPIMLIPFNLVPLVLVTVQYVAMKIGAVAVTTGVFIPDAAACYQRFYRHRASQRQHHAAYQPADWRHAVSAIHAYRG